MLNRPTHPYTQRLIKAVPSLKPRAARELSSELELDVKAVTKTYRSGGGWFGLGGAAKVVRAADEVDATLR